MDCNAWARSGCLHVTIAWSCVGAQVQGARRPDVGTDHVLRRQAEEVNGRSEGEALGYASAADDDADDVAMGWRRSRGSGDAVTGGEMGGSLMAAGPQEDGTSLACLGGAGKAA